MKPKKNNNLKITTNIKADLSAGIIDMIGNDYDSVCQFLGVMLGMMDSGEWGFVDNEMRCENDRALKKNSGLLQGIYLFKYEPVGLVFDLDNRLIKASLLREVKNEVSNK